jgi:hypothetical protein
VKPDPLPPVRGEDLIDAFVEHGFWYGDAEEAQQHIPSIQVRDRLAIKRVLGRAATQIAIRAVGRFRR